ncbi:hypothetical protein Q9966_015335 [Columba livia]|nr:hypothetical protein Q9966_015335 [Columba livia]
MQDSIPQRKGALQRPLGYPRTPETLNLMVFLKVGYGSREYASLHHQVKAKWVGERREGEEPSFIPEFTEYHTGEERSQKDLWFCDTSGNPVAPGTGPGVLHDARRVVKFTSKTPAHAYPKT